MDPLIIAAAVIFVVLSGISIFLLRTLKAERRYLEKVCTDQSILNDDLKENEHRFRCFYENAFEGLAVTRDQIFVDCNHQLAEMFGYRRAELIGQPVTKLVLKDDHDKVIHNITTGYNAPYEHRSVSKNGTIGTVEVCGQQAQYQGQTVRVTAVHDMTEKINAQTLLAKVHAQEHQTGKMEAIGNFAAGIAHDFNNILTPIMGHAGVLLLETQEAAQRESIESILKAADLASQLVHRIQSFTKLDYAPLLHAIDITTVVDECVAFLRSVTPASIEIKLDLKPDLYEILATEITIKQILMNLCKNAAQAIAGDIGRITISISNIVYSNDTDSHRARRYLHLTVADTGCGMTPDVLRRASDPYFTTQQTAKNSGLGLAVVYGIVESYNACMAMESRPEHGTTVTIDIPAASAEQLNQADGEPDDNDISPVLRGNGQNILVVDDEQYIVDVMRNILTSLNYEVTAFSNSAEAWDEFRDHPDKYDLVISDVTMPMMTGIQLIQNIKSINPQVKTILSSGLGSDYKTDKVLAANDIDAFVTKPAGREKYARILTELLGKQSRRQELNGMIKFFSYTKIAIGSVMDIMSAAADGVLTIAEVIEVIKKALHRILPDAPAKDIASFSVLTSVAQYQAADFNDEDVAIIIPRAIMSKLKIAMTP